MYLAINLLTALERRHGPLHAILINWTDQWRWKRQLAAIARSPQSRHFPVLQVIHDRIRATTLEYTSPEALQLLHAAWQDASQAVFPLVETDDRAWLMSNRLDM